MSTPTSALPLGLRHLPGDDWLACHACGTPCAPGAEAVAFDVLGRADAVQGVVATRAQYTFAECERCAEREARAASVLAAHPGIVRAIGGHEVAQHRLVGALCGLAVLEVEPPEHPTAEAVVSLLERLSTAGTLSAFSRLFSPVWREGTTTDTASTEPWLHVSLELRAELRRQYANHRADQLPARPVPCPSGGCAWCGVGTVYAKRTARAWVAHSIAPASLGGNGPALLDRHLCPTCEAIRADGGVMLDSLLMAVDPDRAMRSRRPFDPELRGVRGWAVTGRKPNREPWQHTDRDGLRHLLESGDY